MTLPPFILRMPHMTHTHDIFIIGAGPAGLSAAHAFARLGLSVLMVEKQPLATIANPAVDGRDIALTHFSKHYLTELGMWQYIPAEAVSIIREARVLNGDSTDQLKLATSARDPLGFIVANHYIRAAAYQVVKENPRISILNEMSIESIEQGKGNSVITLSNGEVVQAKLVLAADSRFSESRKQMGIAAETRNFGKTMIVCQMDHEREHGSVAHECFLNGLTLAILPLSGNRSSAVVTLKPEEAAARMECSAEEFSRWVGEHFKHRFGAMTLAAPRVAYPLVGVYAKKFVAQRFALIGDAAVGMHPVTAHGFNFGLHSAHTLSLLVREALQLGGDIGGAELLSRYEHAHRKTTRPLYLTTNGIVSLYTNDSAPARTARKFLMSAADRMVPVKNFLVDKLTEDEMPGSAPTPAPIKLARALFRRAA